ncbi:hypothetical protein P2G88_12595 [Aliiglaciecola sp. CAU 1673]|uniref:TolB family protein n=1 Tax=Aliiglaciecola sp. CAU 1673 TaxID=3032595 RepID=UPI0023D9E12A|nr:hypothetical protein [Aliiglaciecola sp. CAU 1673]MDF2179091.1 hypothetical protein [Aliiglaciecola sp. CAU 1673]
MTARSTEPAWSPDGKYIVFTSQVFGEPAHIWRINADGSDLVNLTEGQQGTFKSPAWSPISGQGMRIAYSQSKDGYGYIWTMQADGSDKRQITSDPNFYDDQPDWSPDGNTLVFQRSGSAVFGDIYKVSAQGGSGTPLVAGTPLALTQSSPKWSPDGRLIAFLSKHQGGEREQIWTIRADGTGLVQRTNETLFLSDPNWIVTAQ